MDFRSVVAAGIVAGIASVCTLSAPATPIQLPPSPIPIPSSTSTATVPAPSATATPPPPTETSAPTPTIRPGVIELTIGQKLTTSHVHMPTINYAFRGERGDVVSIVVTISNAHPSWVYCRAAYTTHLTLDTGTTQISGSASGPTQSSILGYKLRQTAVYYVAGICSGNNCSRDCYEQTIQVVKQ